MNSDITILESIPRQRFLNQITPLERLSRLETLIGHQNLWIKRDDAIPFGQGGNKVRSLEFWMAEAIAQDCDIVIVAGKTVSNLTRATAAAAAKLGLDCLIVYNDHEPQGLEGNFLLSHLFGASSEFLGTVDENARKQGVLAAADMLREQGRRPYIIGDSVTGALGYIAAAHELYEQSIKTDANLKHIILSGSMGTTEAGFLFGCSQLDNPFITHLISIEYCIDEMKARIDTIYRAISDRLKIPYSNEYLKHVRFNGEYLGAGYDQSTPESIAAIRTFASQEGVVLENTYTSKPGAALLDMAKSGQIPPDEPVCLLHTGGVPAIYSQTELFQA